MKLAVCIVVLALLTVACAGSGLDTAKLPAGLANPNLKLGFFPAQFVVEKQWIFVLQVTQQLGGSLSI